MGIGIVVVILIATLSTVPPVDGGTPGQSNATTKPAEAPQSAAVPNHTMTGVVKSVDATRLVITRAGKSPGEMTFELSSATEREGPIVVGATIQVRFRTEGRTPVATAVLAPPPKPPPGAKAPEDGSGDPIISGKSRDSRRPRSPTRRP